MQDCNIGEQNVTGPVKWWYGFKKKKKMIHGFELSPRAWFDLVNSSQHWALFNSFWAQFDHGWIPFGLSLTTVKSSPMWGFVWLLSYLLSPIVWYWSNQTRSSPHSALFYWTTRCFSSIFSFIFSSNLLLFISTTHMSRRMSCCIDYTFIYTSLMPFNYYSLKYMYEELCLSQLSMSYS
jgi:hypothetical protein